MPYLALSGGEAFGRWSCAVARGAVALERCGCVMLVAASFLGYVEAVGGFPADSIRTRITI
eukprot:2097076-Pyramimonas_sp.AAC.1